MLLNYPYINRFLAFLFGLVFFGLTTHSAMAYHYPWDQSHDTTKPTPNKAPPGPCEGASCDPCNSTGSPVYIPTGHFIWTEADVTLAGRPNLSLQRTYNSHDPRDGLFGNGWSASCEFAVYKTVGGEVENGGAGTEYVVLLPSGKRYRYPVAADGTVTTPANRYDSLEPQDDGTVKLTALDGSARVFARNGHLLTRVDRNGNRLKYDYNEAGQLTRMSDEYGRFLAFIYNSAGRVAYVQDHGGRNWHYEYDNDGNLISVTDPEGGLRQYRYERYANPGDGQVYNHLVEITDAGGVRVTQVDYNGVRVASYTEGANTYRYSYNTSQRRVVKTDSEGASWTFDYNTDQVITRIAVANPGGGTDVTEYTYDEDGNRTRIVDPAGQAWAYDYDDLGRLLSATNPRGETTTYSYKDDQPWPDKITSPSQRITLLDYDARGNLLALTDPVGDTLSLSWNETGDLTALTDALGRMTRFAYNDIGLVTTITDPEQRTSLYAYDPLGRRNSATRPAGETQTWTYDDLDRVLTVTNGLGDSSVFAYGPAGRVQSVTDWAGYATTFTYDTHGRQIEETRPDNQTLQYSYNAANQVVAKQTPNGATITYGYDKKQRLSQLALPGQTYTFTYTARDRLATVDQSSGAWQSQYSYDAVGRLATETHNGRAIAVERNAEGEATRWTVDGESQTLARNDRGQITALQTPAGHYGFQYDAAGQLVYLTYPGGEQARTYNQAGQLSSQQMGDSLATRFGYAYDRNGRLSQRQGEGTDWYYGYDAADQLTSANHGTEQYAYQYDANGNRLEGGRQYDAFNKLLSRSDRQYQHDANGNRIQALDPATGDRTVYGYDALNRLTHAAHYPEGGEAPAWTASYAYDAFNRRIRKTVAGETTESTEYLWFGSRLVAEYTDGAVTPSKRYRYTQNSFAPISYSESSQHYAVHSDYLDTPKLLTDMSGQTVWSTVLSPYGQTIENTDPDNDGQPLAFNIRFPGQYHDRETGLYYNWNRTYDPGNGRYIQSDPIGLLGGLNTFGYALQSPTNAVDPEGLIVCGGVCVAGAAVGVARAGQLAHRAYSAYSAASALAQQVHQLNENAYSDDGNSCKVKNPTKAKSPIWNSSGLRPDRNGRKNNGKKGGRRNYMSGTTPMMILRSMTGEAVIEGQWTQQLKIFINHQYLGEPLIFSLGI